VLCAADDFDHVRVPCGLDSVCRQRLKKPPSTIAPGSAAVGGRLRGRDYAGDPFPSKFPALDRNARHEFVNSTGFRQALLIESELPGLHLVESRRCGQAQSARHRWNPLIVSVPLLESAAPVTPLLTGRG
jgi:hypothetical protein